MGFLHPSKAGTGIIELMVYMALLSVLSIGAIDLVLQAYTTMTKARLQRTVTGEGELAMQRMTREIRNAYDIDTPYSTFDASPGALRLRTYSDAAGSATTTADFRIISDVLHMNRATTSVDLTSSNVSITNLVFRNIHSTTTPKAVRIEMTLTASSSRFSITSPFYVTATLRGSY